MRRWVVALAMTALIASGGASVFAGGKCSTPCSPGAKGKSAGAACSTEQSATACVDPQNKVAGHFDATMSGVCRFACATKLEYKAADVAAQPGAKAGKLTQCPVSGVVFAVDATRPRVRVAGGEYATCCDKCATKLKRDPRHYLKV